MALTVIIYDGISQSAKDLKQHPVVQHVEGAKLFTVTSVDCPTVLN